MANTLCPTHRRSIMRFVALLMALALTACHHGSNDQTRYMRNISLSEPTPAPETTLASKYVAINAGRPGQPRLTLDEIDRVQKVLREVKPCQRTLLRYAFPGGDRKNGAIAVFFPIVQEGHGYSGSHVFGTTNGIYMWNGRVIGTMFTITDKQAIDLQKCSPK